jgi:hypothetical protein
MECRFRCVSLLAQLDPGKTSMNHIKSISQDALAVQQFDWFYHLRIMLSHMDRGTVVGQLMSLAQDAHHQRGHVLMAVCIWLDAAMCALNDGDLDRCFEALQLASLPFGHAAADFVISAESVDPVISLDTPLYHQLCIAVIFYLVNKGQGKVASDWNVILTKRTENEISNMVSIPCGKHVYLLELMDNAQLVAIVWFLSGVVSKVTDGGKAAKYLEHALMTVNTFFSTTGTIYFGRD